MPALTSLRLPHARLQLCEAYVLAELLGKARGLQRVDLSWNMWGSEGERILAAAVNQVPGLQLLNVQGLAPVAVQRAADVKSRLLHRDYGPDNQKHIEAMADKELPRNFMATRDPAGRVIPLYMQAF